MPETVAAYVISAFALEGVAATVVYAAAYAATTAAISYGVSSLAKSQAKKSARSAGTDPQARKLMVRSSIEPHKVIYGRAVVSGPMVYGATSDATFASGTVLVNEYVTIPSAAPYTITVPSYNSDLLVQTIDSTEYSVAYTALTSTGGAPSSGQYSVSGGVYTFNSAQAGVAVQISYYKTVTTTIKNHYLHLVIPLAGHEVDAIEEVYVNGEAIDIANRNGSGFITTGRYAGLIRVKLYLGTDSQTADSDLVAEAPSSSWTSNHRLRGRAYVYLRLAANPSVFPTAPAVSAKVRGKKVYDPRSTLTVWSDNWALCVRDFCTSAWGLNAPSARIDDTYVTSAANISDETVGMYPSGNHVRYTINGAFARDGAPAQILEELLKAGEGWFSYTAGVIRIGAGAYVSPTFSLTTADLAGDIKFTTKAPRRELFNTVRGTFVSAARNYQVTDYPPVTSATYKSDDGGDELVLDQNYDFVDDASRAQRLSKIRLQRSRQGVRVIWPGNMRCLQAAIGLTCSVTVSTLGWSSKVFKVVDWQYSTPGLVDLVLEEESSGVYTWSGSDAGAFDDNPDTILPNPFFVPSLLGLGCDSGGDEVLIDADGTVVSRILVTWTVTSSLYVYRNGKVQVQWTPTTNPSFADAPTIEVPGNATQAYISPIDKGGTYLVRARFENSIGVRGPWTAPVAITNTTRSTPPTFNNWLQNERFQQGFTASTAAQSNPFYSGKQLYSTYWTIEVSNISSMGWVTPVLSGYQIPGQEGGIYVNAFKVPNTGYAFLVPNYKRSLSTVSSGQGNSFFPVIPGNRYQFSAEVAALTCDVGLSAYFYTHSGGLLKRVFMWEYPGSTDGPGSETVAFSNAVYYAPYSGTDIWRTPEGPGWQRIWSIVTAPDSATRMTFAVNAGRFFAPRSSHWSGNSGQQFWAMVNNAMFADVGANQEEPSPFSQFGGYDLGQWWNIAQGAATDVYESTVEDKNILKIGAYPQSYTLIHSLSFTTYQISDVVISYSSDARVYGVNTSIENRYGMGGWVTLDWDDVNSPYFPIPTANVVADYNPVPFYSFGDPVKWNYYYYSTQKRVASVAAGNHVVQVRLGMSDHVSMSVDSGYIDISHLKIEVIKK